jgi:tetratricopeptide (TPR) repeat protein
MYDRTRENLEHAITYFKSAIEQDNEFARAYAAIAMAYYHLDEFQADKKHASEINYYSDQAILLDSDLPQSLIAKALFYMSNKEYPLAVSFFEKALDYNPNNSLALVYLVDLYVNYIPNTQKYLEYALRGLEIDVGAYDSLTTSFIYLHISNAFIQSGFEDEAEKYINKSLGYNDENLYSEYTKAYILYAKNRDLEHTKDLLIKALAKDTTRLDIMQEVGKMYYYLRDYENAYHYYKKFTDIREALNLDIYKSENSKIGFVFSKMGLNAESERYFDEFKQYLEIDQTIYKDLSMGAYYSYLGDTKKAIERLRLFAQQDNYHYWIVLFLKIEPLLDNIKDLPEFQKISREIETKFWDYHKQIRSSLEEKGLIRSIH